MLDRNEAKFGLRLSNRDEKKPTTNRDGQVNRTTHIWSFRLLRNDPIYGRFVPYEMTPYMVVSFPAKRPHIWSFRPLRNDPIYGRFVPYKMTPYIVVLPSTK